MSSSVSAPRIRMQPARVAKRMWLGRISWYGDSAAVALLLAIIAVTVGFRFFYDNWLAQYDIFNFFLPNYGYVGSRLREFQIPAWNPYFFSGTPMAGDSESGWMYLPAMTAFALFSTATAMKVMVLLQTLVGALATYLFGRRLGFLPLAALFAAATLAVGPALYDATGHWTVVGQIAAWLPVAMAGAECALQADRWPSRLAWAGLSGIGLVEMFAAWPQGFVYGALLMGAWFLYRTVIDPPVGARRDLAHVGRAAAAGVASGAFAALLGAAAILPRLDFSAQSNIPGGDYANVPGGHYAAGTDSWVQILGVYLQGSFRYRIIEFNAVIILLALLALTLTPRRYGAVFWTGAILLFVDLAATRSFTRPLFYLVPVFKTIHSHRPTASMYMVYLPLAMLAGAGVQAVLRPQRIRLGWLRRLLPLPLLLVALAIVVHAKQIVAHSQVGLPILATIVILVAAGHLRWPQRPADSRVLHACALALLALSLAYPSGVDFIRVLRDPDNHQNNLLSADPAVSQKNKIILAHRDPGTAASLLQYLQAAQPPFRYASYFGSGSPGSHNTPSTLRDREPGIMAILTNGRSVQLGLEQVSGYNPMHLATYVDYMTAMNGRRQNYHYLDVYAAALENTQLLDMLNVRYVLVPARLKKLPPIVEDWQMVYRDDLVVVYENTQAFPRAWIVHQVLPDQGDTGLKELASGAVDGHEVAFVTGTIVPTTPSAGVPAPAQPPARAGTSDQVTVTDLQPERISMRTTAGSSGFLVVSQPYARGWHATIDGHAVPVLQTNHALQGLYLPAGTHTVVVSYTPRSLAIGLPVTGAAAVALTGLGVWAVIDDRRRRRRVRRASSCMGLPRQTPKPRVSP